MSGYEGYSTYKHAQSKWVDFIPNDWETLPLKFIVKIRITDGPHETPIFTDSGVPFLSAEAVKNNKLDFTRRRGFISEYLHREYSRKCLPKRNDVFMVKSGNTTGNLAMVETDLEFNIWSPLALIRANTDLMAPRFLYFSMLSNFFRNSVELSWSQGTQPNIGMGVIENLHVCRPSLDEQQKIANFLDHETAKIDTLIEKQQQLIKLLKEKRQAVISHAVTKGLNPDAPMKDSGVEWLGEVPAHWVTTKLSNRFIVQLGKMLDDKKITGEFLGEYLRNTDVQWGSINTNNLPKMDFRSSERERFTVKTGDLLVCEGGEIGRCAIWTDVSECFYQKALHRLRPINSAKDSSDFLYFVLFTSVHQGRFLSAAEKATIAHLPAEAFRRYIFAFPPNEEQVAIATYLKAKCDAFEQMENSIAIQNSLLKERRTALISAAVTGKIDVRNWQPPKPSTTTSKDV